VLLVQIYAHLQVRLRFRNKYLYFPILLLHLLRARLLVVTANKI